MINAENTITAKILPDVQAVSTHQQTTNMPGIVSLMASKKTLGSKGNVVLLNVATEISDLLYQQLDDDLNLEALSALEQLLIGMQQGRIHADTLVLGVSLEEPVRIAQRIHSLGMDIPVLILTEPEHHGQLKQALKFAPFLGNDVIPCSTANFHKIPGILLNTVERTRKRRLHRGSVAAAQISLRKISEPKPHVTHYFERLLDRAPIGVLNLNVNGEILNLNRHACQVLQVSEREALGTALVDMFVPQERDRLKATIARCVAPLGCGKSETFKANTHPERHVEVIASSLVDRSGQLGATIIMQDVTSRIRAEEARIKAVNELKASEYRYRELVETMNEALALTDHEYRITFVNRRFCDLFGYSSEEVIGRPLISLVHEEAKGTMQQQIAATKPDKLESFEAAWRTKEGRKVYTLTSPKSIFDENGGYTGCLGVFTDITERKEVEQREKMHMLELAQVSRVSTIGEMSSQIAHELAQPLSAIGGMSSALLKLLNTGAETREDLTETLGDIQEQAKRAREIIIRVRNFVRHDELSHVPLDLNQLIHTVVRLTHVDARWKGVAIDLALTKTLPQAMGDKILIEQVLLNLVRNACEAMQEAGKDCRQLTLATRTVSPAFLEISVNDTGPGLSDEMLKQVCNPFFTTKSNSMGMGLAIVRSVVDAHGGQLSICNNAQGGASFSFTLPVSTNE